MSNLKIPQFVKIATLAVSFIFVLPACGEEPDKDAKCMVFKIQGEKATVYLAGSIHLLRKSDYPLPPAYNAAYEDSSILAFELPAGSISDPETQRLTMKLGFYPGADTIDDHLSEETLKVLDAYMKKAGMPPGMKKMRPWLITLAISVGEITKLGAEPEIGIDRHYEIRGKKDGKKMEGLETVESQLRIFADLPVEQQDELLLKTIQELDDVEKNFDKMLETWRSGDAEGLFELMHQDTDEHPELMEALLDKRNASWIDQIVGYVEGDKNVMVIVGAAHLAGENSVIDLLDKKGIKAVQVGATVKK